MKKEIKEIFTLIRGLGTKITAIEAYRKAKNMAAFNTYYFNKYPTPFKN